MFLFKEVSEQTTKIVSYCSIGAAVLLMLALVAVCAKNKKFDTKTIAFAALTIALSFALSLIKFSPVTYGGSITLASFTPIILFALVFPATQSLIVGLIFGLLNFISSPYILAPATFILDYALAFMSLAVAPLAHKLTKSLTANFCIATVLVYSLRFIFHLTSGFIYFMLGAIWADLPTANAFVYSFLYQITYLAPDCAICVAVIFTLCKTGTVKRLVKTLLPANGGAYKLYAKYPCLCDVRADEYAGDECIGSELNNTESSLNENKADKIK